MTKNYSEMKPAKNLGKIIFPNLNENVTTFFCRDKEYLKI